MSILNFEQIVDQYYALLYRFALSLARNPDDASDLTQQTFSVWATRGDQLRDTSKIKTWLFTTLYREFLSQRRRLLRWPQQELSEVEEELTSPLAETSEFLQKMEGTEVLTLLQTLDETFRVPLVLFYLEEHSYEEIATVLGLPIGTVMSRLARGKAKFKKLVLNHQQNKSEKIIPWPKASGGSYG